MGGFIPGPSPFGRGPFMPNYDPVVPQRKGPMDNASQESNVNTPPPNAIKNRIQNRMGSGAGEDRVGRFNRMKNRLQPSMGGFNLPRGGALPPMLAQGGPMASLQMLPQQMMPPQDMPQRSSFPMGMGGFGQRMM